MRRNTQRTETATAEFSGSPRGRPLLHDRDWQAPALTDLVRNGATIVVADWTGDLDTERLRRTLDGEADEEAEEPEAVLDRHPAHLPASA